MLAGTSKEASCWAAVGWVVEQRNCSHSDSGFDLREHEYCDVWSASRFRSRILYLECCRVMQHDKTAFTINWANKFVKFDMCSTTHNVTPTLARLQSITVWTVSKQLVT